MNDDTDLEVRITVADILSRFWMIRLPLSLLIIKLISFNYLMLFMGYTFEYKRSKVTDSR